jgi:GR25 family glycosyltransferase involved in LPS biosynthesis
VRSRRPDPRRLATKAADLTGFYLDVDWPWLRLLERLRLGQAPDTKESHALQIRVISLQRSVDRRAACVSALEGSGLSWSFWDAIDGRLLRWERALTRPADVRFFVGEEIASLPCSQEDLSLLSPGQYGCLLSHYLLWKEFLASTDEYVFVLEDDFMFLTDPTNIVGEISAAVDESDWDILYLQRHTSLRRSLLPLRARSGMLRMTARHQMLRHGVSDARNNRIKTLSTDVPNLWGTYAYVLGRSGATRLVDTMKIDGLNIDNHLCRLVQERSLTGAFLVMPCVGRGEAQQFSVIRDA